MNLFLENHPAATKKRKKYTRRVFTNEEDQMLLKLVEKYHENWKKISNEMKDRNIRQCKERYLHYLSPNIKHDYWTPEEDAILLKNVENYGRKWKFFEYLFPKRTEIDIRNRYYVLFRKIKKENRKKNLSSLKYSQIESPSVTPVQSELSNKQYTNQISQKDIKIEIANHNLSQNQEENGIVNTDNDFNSRVNFDNSLFDYFDSNDFEFLSEKSTNEFAIYFDN